MQKKSYPRSIEEINNNLKDLWALHFKSTQKVYSPIQYQNPPHNALVFVGLNPSFSSKGWVSILKRSDLKDLKPEEFFEWPTPNNFDIKVAHELESLALNHYPFFAPHRALAEAIQMPWVHFDLFAYRETKQEKVRPLILEDKNGIKLSQFGRDQFDIFQELLILARPAAVIVINALASQIYFEIRKPVFEPTLGYYRDKFFLQDQVPVFFSGMLTGGRALDRFSRDRLFWQVAHALKKTWKPKTL